MASHEWIRDISFPAWKSKINSNDIKNESIFRLMKIKIFVCVFNNFLLAKILLFLESKKKTEF